MEYIMNSQEHVTPFEGGLFVCAGTRRDRATGEEVVDFVDVTKIADKEFGRQLQKARHRKDWSVPQLAKRARVDRCYVEAAEQDPGRVPMFVLSAIADAFGGSLNIFVDGSVRTVRSKDI